MPQLKVHNDFKSAVVIDGSSFISSEEGILHEYVSDNEVLLYIKSKDGKKEVKIKIVKEK
jgi:hypothetical protein